MMKPTTVAAAALLTLAGPGTAHAQMSALAGVQSAQADQLFVLKTGRRGCRIAAWIALDGHRRSCRKFYRRC